MKPAIAEYLKERRVEPRMGEERFIRLGEVLATCGKSRSSVYAGISGNVGQVRLQTQTMHRALLTHAQSKPDQNHERAPQAREAAAQRQQLADSERAGPVGPTLRIPRAGRAGALLLSAGRRKKKLPEGSFLFFVFGGERELESWLEKGMGNYFEE